MRWAVGLVLLLVSGCTYETAAQHSARRTAELRAELPPGATHRTDVRARWGHEPELALTRPRGGWDQPFIRDVEEQTGETIALAEKYVRPTGTSAGFFTLEHVWCFYDRDEAVVDVRFERIGD